MKSSKLVLAIGTLAGAGGLIAAAGAAMPAAHLSAPPTEQSTGQEVEPQFERVKLRDDGESRVTIPVSIDGSAPFDFLIDTGSEGTVLSNRLVDRLGMVPSGRVTVVSMADTADVDTVDLSSVAFAGRDIGSIAAPVLQYEHIGVDGILGLDALQDLRVLIDFREGTMDVEDAYKRPSGGRYDVIVQARRLRGQMVITDAVIDGVEAAVIVDTGAQFSIGNMELLRRIRAKERESVEGTDVLGTGFEGRISRLRHTRIGKLELGTLPLAFFDSPAFDMIGYRDKPALILGIGNLRRLDRVAIDFRNRKVMFDLPRGGLGSPDLRLLEQATRIPDQS